PKPLLVSDEGLARQIDAFGRVIDDLADNPGFPIMFFEYGQHRADVCFTDNDAKSDTHIVNLEHLGDADVAKSLYHLENCRRLRHFIDQETGTRMLDAGQIEKAIAGDVRQRLDARHLPQNFMTSRT